MTRFLFPAFVSLVICVALTIVLGILIAATSVYGGLTGWYSIPTAESILLLIRWSARLTPVLMIPLTWYLSTLDK